MLAVQIAALIVLHNKGKLLDGATLDQLSVNFFLVSWVAIAGFLPITFTLACLHMVNRRSWYILCLSGLTIAVSMSTFFVAKAIVPSPADVGDPPVTVTACGSSNPIKFCYSGVYRGLAVATWSTSNGLGGLSMLLFSCIIYALLVIDMCLHSYVPWATRLGVLGSPKRESTVFSNSDAKKQDWRSFGNFLKQDSRQILRLASLVIYLCALAGYIYFYYYYMNLLSQFRSTVIPSWSFGQIVAVTIWLPVIFEFGYLMIRKSNTTFSTNGLTATEIKDRRNPLRYRISPLRALQGHQNYASR